MKAIVFLIAILAVITGNSADSDSLKSNGKASFYAEKFHGRETSSGELYNKNDFTAAHRNLPFNSFVHVYNKQNKKSVIVRINDRGPFIKSRIIDLSGSAAKKLHMVAFGVVPVTIHVLNFLDYLPLSDSSFKDGDIWDCFGKKRSFEKEILFLWKTDQWKHAFYMASHISLEFKTEDVLVKVEGQFPDRFYSLYLSNITTSKQAEKLAQQVKSEGFVRAKLLPRQESVQHE